MNNLTQFVVGQDQKIDELNSIWGDQFQDYIIHSVSELSSTDKQ